MERIIDSRFTDPPHRIPDLDTVAGKKPPEYATVRRLNFRINPGANEDEPDELELYFTGACVTVKLTDYPRGLAELLDLVRTGNFAYPDAGYTKPAAPYKTQISLNNSAYRYIIYRLSDKKNWQFSHRKPPFSVGEEEAEAKAYFEARRISAKGEEQSGDGPETHGCRTAYFVADGDLRNSQKPLPAGYTDAYNIHVDLIFKGSDGKPTYVPVDIDPDVRHPGGSGA